MAGDFGSQTRIFKLKLTPFCALLACLYGFGTNAHAQTTTILL